MYIENTDTSLLFYLNRDTFERVIIPVYRKDYTTELDELLTWLNSLETIIESGKTPVFFKGYRQNSRICKQCPFQEHCAAVGQGTEEIDRLRVLE
jgi:CRISPR/Cas system-associated exonuclease Cas4 (RecB family)